MSDVKIIDHCSCIEILVMLQEESGSRGKKTTKAILSGRGINSKRASADTRTKQQASVGVGVPWAVRNSCNCSRNSNCYALRNNHGAMQNSGSVEFSDYLKGHLENQNYREKLQLEKDLQVIKEKDLEVKEKELSLKEKELDLKAKELDLMARERGMERVSRSIHLLLMLACKGTHLQLLFVGVSHRCSRQLWRFLPTRFPAWFPGNH